MWVWGGVGGCTCTLFSSPFPFILSSFCHFCGMCFFLFFSSGRCGTAFSSTPLVIDTFCLSLRIHRVRWIVAFFYCLLVCLSPHHPPALALSLSFQETPCRPVRTDSQQRCSCCRMGLPPFRNPCSSGDTTNATKTHTPLPPPELPSTPPSPLFSPTSSVSQPTKQTNKQQAQHTRKHKTTTHKWARLQATRTRWSS